MKRIRDEEVDKIVEQLSDPSEKDIDTLVNWVLQIKDKLSEEDDSEDTEETESYEEEVSEAEYEETEEESEEESG